MKLLQWTIFIDMLGYRDINGSIDNEISAMELIKFMEKNKLDFDVQNNNMSKEYDKRGFDFNLYDYYEIKYAFVSDSFILTFYPLDDPNLKNLDKMYMHSANALFIITMRLQGFIFNCFSEKGVFLRGGISNKYCYIKDSFVVGEGLIEAYKTESSVAKYPRIAFSRDVTDNKRLIEKVTFLSNKMYNGSQLIAVDPIDNIRFLDYLSLQITMVDSSNKGVMKFIMENFVEYTNSLKSVRIFLQKHSFAIECKLKELEEKKENSSGPKLIEINKVIDKFNWLKCYHNNSLEKMKNFSDYIID